MDFSIFLVQSDPKRYQQTISQPFSLPSNNNAVILTDPDCTFKFLVNRKLEDTDILTESVIFKEGTRFVEMEKPRDEVVVVNFANDQKLLDLCKQLDMFLEKKSDPLHESLIHFVEEKMGGPGVSLSSYNEHLGKLMEAHGKEILLGQFRYGTSKHRALLFKVFCDYLKIPCTFQSAFVNSGASKYWNVIFLDKKKACHTLLWEESEGIS